MHTLRMIWQIRSCSHEPARVCAPPLPMAQALDTSIEGSRASWGTIGDGGNVRRMLAKFESEQKLAVTLPSRTTKGTYAR